MQPAAHRGQGPIVVYAMGGDADLLNVSGPAQPFYALMLFRLIIKKNC